MPNFHRVVITGIGAAPIGNNIDEYLVGLQSRTNGVSILLFDPDQHPCKFAAGKSSIWY